MGSAKKSRASTITMFTDWLRLIVFKLLCIVIDRSCCSLTIININLLDNLHNHSSNSSLSHVVNHEPSDANGHPNCSEAKLCLALEKQNTGRFVSNCGGWQSPLDGDGERLGHAPRTCGFCNRDVGGQNHPKVDHRNSWVNLTWGTINIYKRSRQAFQLAQLPTH